MEAGNNLLQLMKDKTFAGGRGCKAPYKTAVLRVPEPLVPAIEEMIKKYRLEVSEGSPESEATVTGVLLSSLIEIGTGDQLIETAKQILKKRGTRKAALAKLLQVTLNRTVSQKELED